MKTIYYLLFFSCVLVFHPVLGQNTFWIVKGGSGDEVGTKTGAQLDTTASGNLIWMYATRSTSNGRPSVVMEKWLKGTSSPSSELLLGSTSGELMHNLHIHQDEMYILGTAGATIVSPNSRPYMVRADTNGQVLATFLQHGLQMSSYGNYYEAFFIQDTAFVVGQGRSGYGGDREDYLISRFDLGANTMVFSQRYHGLGTERIYDIEPSSTGDTLFAAAYSYGSAGYTDPVLFLFNRNGAIINDFSYSGGNASFSKIVKTESDSLIMMGYHNSNIQLTKLGIDGGLAWSRSYTGSTGTQFRCVDIHYHNKTLFLFGKVQNESTGMGGEEGLLIALDTVGTVLWSKMYGGSGDENITDIQFFPGGLYLTGYTTTSSQGGKDVFLIKADMNGNASFNSSCFGITSYTATVQSTNINFSRNTFHAIPSGAVSNYSHPITTSPVTNMLDDHCGPLQVAEEAMEEEGIERLWNVYPNPFTDFVDIQLPGTEEGRLHLTLVDEIGRLVRRLEYKHNPQEVCRLQLADVPPGMYVLQATWFENGSYQRYQQKIVRSR